MTLTNIPKGFQSTEIGLIPVDWKIKQAKDISSCIVPGRNKPKKFDGTIPWVTTSDIDELGQINNSNISLFISKEEANSIGSKVVPINSVIMSCVGELGVVAVVENELVINQQLHAFLPDSKVNSKYLSYILSSLREYFYGKATKTTLPYLNKNNCNSTPIPLPCIEEQTAIANALSDVDALLTELEKLIAKKQAIKTATMQQLLTGKTRLPQFAFYSNESTEVATDTEGAVKGKNQGVPKGKSKGTKPSELGEIPEDWDVYAIGSLFNITAGGDLRKNQFSPLRTDKHLYPIYSNAITNKGLYGYCSTFDYDGECLTITARGGIGHAVNRDESFCAIGRLLVLFPKQNTNCKYVAEFTNQYIGFANESTGVPQLTAPQVAKYKIAIPEYEEQTIIATILSDMDNEIQTLEQRLAKTRQIKQGMMQELLTGRTRLPFDKEAQQGNQ